MYQTMHRQPDDLRRLFREGWAPAEEAAQRLATALGESRKSAATSSFRAALGQLADQVADVLARADQVLPVARNAASRRMYSVGAGPNEATALEAVIKVREAAQGWIDGLALEQFLHGPLVAANADDIALVVNVPGRAAERVGQIARVLDAVGVRIWLIGGGVDGLAKADVFALPAVTELLSPLLTV